MVRPFQGRFPLSRLFLLVVALSLFSPLAAIAERYPDPPVPTGSFVFLDGNPTVNGALLDVGDEIAAYSVHPKPGVAGKFEKVLIGHGVVTVAGQLDATPAYGDDAGTTGAVEGAVPGEEICLVLWRAAEGKEYTAYLDGAGGAGKAVWTSNLATVAVNVDFVEGQRIPLRNNAWNLFAYSVLSGYDNVMPTQPQLSGLTWHGVANLGEALPLKSIAGKYVRVLGNDGLGSKFWDPVLATISSLKSISPGYGYWIKMKVDAGGLPLSWMTVAGGRMAGAESLALGTGWTLLGYWGDPIYHLPTYDALSDLYPVDASDNVAIPSMGVMWASIDTQYVRMTSFDGQGAHFWNPSILPQFQTLKYMGPGYGYWVKMSTAGVLTYPSRYVPSGVHAVAGDNQVTVSWLPVTGATSYKIYWGTSPGVTKATGTPIAGVTSPYVHTGRSNGTTYYYIVTAVVGGVEGSASAEVSATPAAASLAPSITTFSPSSGIAGDNVTIIGENFPIGGTTVSFFNGVPATVVSNTGTVLQVTVPPGAATGAITVTTSAGSASTASPFGIITVPLPPTGVNAAAGINLVTLSWSASSGAASYRVYWSTSASVSKGSYTGMVDNAISPFVHSPLTAGVPYYYVVTARNRAGESADSSPVVSATPVTAPPTITGFAPPSGAVGDSVTITGTNFNTVAVSNTVRFNGTQAIVTSATATQITAIVPAGATSGPVTVTTAGGTATSSSSFAVTSPGYSISGDVSYPGSRTGRIYLNVIYTGGSETGYGTSISAPGAFTIRGVPPGSWVVRAYRDTQGNGTQVGFSPTGSSGVVTISGGNASGANLTLSDPGTVTPVSPASVSVLPGSGCALVFFNAPRNGNGVEIAQSYNLYWSASPSVSPSSFTGRKQGILAPGDNYVQWGLTNGTVLYYVATAVSGGVESAPSPRFGPVTIGAPAGGTTVSGTVSVPGLGTPTGPLYLALGPVPVNSTPLYIATVTSPTNPQAYTISGVQPGTYSVYAILDMNQDNVVGIGDIGNTDMPAPQFTVGGSPVSGANVTLVGGNAIASVPTSHGTPGDWYNVYPRVDEKRKQVTNVTVTQGTYLPVPVDMGRGRRGEYNVRVYSPRPNIGDNYVFTVSYSDGSSETLSALVTGVLDSFATPTYPVGTVSGPSALTPTFTWTPPSSPPASYTYRLWMWGSSGEFWSASWDLPSTQTSAAYNFDGTASLGSLAYGTTYSWTLSVRDANGNETQNNVSFTVAAPLPPTVTGFSPGSGSAGDPVTITGTNFDPVPGNNTVRFAGTQAVVTGATATQIVALVPAGAVSGPISVTTAGGTATSSGSFTIIVTISFTGKVVDFAGAAVSGALIERVGAPSNNTSSLGNGTFVLSGIPGGTPFSLKVSKAAFVPTYSFSILSGSDINATATPFILYTSAQLTGLGVTPGKGVIFGTVVNGATLAPVEGAVVTASSSLHPSTPYTVTYSTGTGFGGAATFANGIFVVRNTDDGDTVTINTTRSGWTFSPAVAASHADSATLVLVLGTVTPPSPGYSVSGNVSYPGSRTGRIYLNVAWSGGGETGYGVSIAGPGSFTIRGVPPGSYVVKAYRDTQGNGTQVGFSPTGSSGTVTISGGNVSGANITLSDPGTVTPVSPSSVGAIPGNGCALVFFDAPRNGNGVEIAQSYNLYWSTSSSVSPGSFTGRKTGIPAPGDNYVQRGLTNGTVRYYVATAVSGGVESAPSPVFGPMTIGSPAGGTTVSGTVSGVTPTGPLYVALVPGNSGPPSYIAVVASPTNSQAYTVSGVQPGTYSVYAILDMNQDNTVGLGDVMNIEEAAPQITVGGSPVSGANVTLVSRNATPAVRTSHGASGASEWYNVSPLIEEMRKQVTNVTVTQGTYLPVPVDMGRREWREYNVWVGSPRPNIGDNYVFTVSYSDNTGETLSALVTGVLDGIPTPTYPVGTVSGSGVLAPTFRWSPPSPAPSTNYTYDLYLQPSGGGTIWQPERMSSSQTSAAYDFDGSANVAQLTFGTMYYWTISVRDPYGNEAQYYTSFTPVSGSMAGTPSAPSQLTGVGVDGAVKLRWFNNAGGYPLYRVYRGASSGPRGSKTLLGGSQSTTFTDNGLVNGTTYYYTVTAVTEGGESADSAEFAVAPQANTYLAQSGYVQKRPGALRYFIAMLDPVTGAGIPVANLDNVSIGSPTVTGPGGGVTISTRLKWVSYYAPLTESGTPTPGTGLIGALSAPGTELPTGFYTLRASDTLGRNYVWTTWYDNTTVPPGAVDNTTMSATYGTNGSLTVSWSKQASLPVANYPGGVYYRVVAYTKTDHNGDGQVDEVYISPQISISDGQSSYAHAIDNESLTYFRGYLGGFPITEFYWQVETRVYRNGNEVYRDPSGRKDLPGSQVIDKYVQLRKEGTGRQAYFIWSQVSRPFGVPMVPAEFSSISLVDNTTGNPVPLAAGTMMYIYSPFHSLNPSSPGTVTRSVAAGGRAELSAPVGTLPAGTYTVRLTDTAANTYPFTVFYPGDVVLPAVDNATMLETPNPDGSVTLSWLTPAGMDNTMQYRVHVISRTVDLTGDGQPDDLMYSAANFLPAGATNTMVVPSSLVSSWRAAYAPGELLWDVQTRKYDTNGVNYSRTYSGTRVFPLP